MVCRLPLGRRYDLDEVALLKPGQLPESVNRLRLSVGCPPSIWGTGALILEAGSGKVAESTRVYCLHHVDLSLQKVLEQLLLEYWLVF